MRRRRTLILIQPILRSLIILLEHLRAVYQLNNLIDKPAHAALQAKLEKRMRELMEEAGDPGDTDKIMAYRESRRTKSM